MLVAATTIIGVAASLVGFLAFFSPDMGREMIRRLRRAPTYDWPTIPVQIRKAQHRVLILQTWLPALRLEIPCWSKALEKEGVDFRVLLADQKLVPYRLRSREPVSSLLIQNVSDICEFIESYADTARSKMQVRFYSTLPFGPIYIIDDDIYWGLYLSHMDSMAGPVFRERSGSRLGKEIISSFQNVWQDASDRTGTLSVAQHFDRKKLDHAREEVDFARRAAAMAAKVSRQSGSAAREAPSRRSFICILRHAETDLSEASIITGALDVGINAFGRTKLRQLGDHFEREHWTAIYSSPARRCTETLAEILKAEGSAIQIRDELRERSMGDLEGFSKHEYHRSLPQYSGLDLLNSFHAAADGGESYCDVFRRVATFMEGIVQQILEGDKVLVCTHDTTIRMMTLLLENLAIEDAVSLEVSNADPVYYVSRF